jgi:anti-sigma B factor antagonist
MPSEESGIQVGEMEGVVFVRVQGRGTHQNSHLLKQYMLSCLEEHHRLFQIDLCLCNYMDSTFLGMLAGLGIRVKDRSLPQIQLSNVNERIRSMLEGLGIDHLFSISTESETQKNLTHLTGEDLTKDAKSREMLEAHEKLVSISSHNEAKFRDVLVLLREKTKRSETK